MISRERERVVSLRWLRRRTALIALWCSKRRRNIKDKAIRASYLISSHPFISITTQHTYEPGEAQVLLPPHFPFPFSFSSINPSSLSLQIQPHRWKHNDPTLTQAPLTSKVFHFLLNSSSISPLFFLSSILFSSFNCIYVKNNFLLFFFFLKSLSRKP